MNTSKWSVPAIVLSGLLLAGGCAESITYSNNSRAAGIKLYEQQSFAGAAGAFRNAVTQEPRDYESRYWLGMTYDRLGQHQLAMQAYNGGLLQMAQSVEGRHDVELREKIINAMAASIASSQQLQLEIAQFEARTDFDAQIILAKVYRNLGDADNAIEKYTAAVNVQPNNFRVTKEFAQYLQQLNQRDHAIEVLKQAYTLNPNDAEVIAALEGYDIVVGPSLKPADKLAKPLMPNGPLPDLRPFRDSRYSSEAQPASAESAPIRDLVPYQDEGPRD